MFQLIFTGSHCWWNPTEMIHGAIELQRELSMPKQLKSTPSIGVMLIYLYLTLIFGGDNLTSNLCEYIYIYTYSYSYTYIYIYNVM